MGIPFLFELKTFSDWFITYTSLPLGDWLRFQQIYAKIFIAKCDVEEIKNKSTGQSVKTVTKFFLG